MLEFNGKLTGNAKKFFYKKTVCIAILEMLVGSLIGSITTIVAWYIYFNIFEFYSIVAGVCIVVIMSLLPCTMFLSKRIVPQKVTVRQTAVCSQTGFRTKTLSIKDVKKVCDYGDYYYIVANFLNHSSIFVCQKDLLTKGTLEEFEMLFGDKIVRRKTQGDGSSVFK